jgi:hypothetical protein
LHGFSNPGGEKFNLCFAIAGVQLLRVCGVTSDDIPFPGCHGVTRALARSLRSSSPTPAVKEIVQQISTVVTRSAEEKRSRVQSAVESTPALADWRGCAERKLAVLYKIFFHPQLDAACEGPEDDWRPVFNSLALLQGSLMKRISRTFRWGPNTLGRTPLTPN